jgi:hypothetical protein
MPALNNFFARIEAANVWSNSRILREYGRHESADGKTVFCYIGVKTRDYFRVTFGYDRRKQKDAFAYSAIFYRDGEAIRHLAFSASDAVELDGIIGDWKDPAGKKWAFQFRGFECTGESDDPSVP